MANFLQLNDNSKFDVEEQVLANYFGEGNYTPFYRKHIIQGKLKITKNDFIAGDIPSMFAAMKQLGIKYTYNDYPDSLRKHLHRKIWSSTMKDVRQILYNDLNSEFEFGLNWFIKPKDKLKRFTGFVCTSIDDLQYCKGAGNNVKLWCSEPVRFLSEWRCPVINGDVKGIYPAPGSEKELLKYNARLILLDTVKTWVKDFKKCPKAYCLDVGILSNGTPALIEVNDGFSVGKYGMPDEVYAELLITRWNELKSLSKPH